MEFYLEPQNFWLINGQWCFITHFLLPFLNYCCVIWGSAPKTTLRRLDLLQKRAFKVILGMPQRTNSNYVYAKTKVLTLGEIYELQTLIFMYKYANGLLPQGLSGMFTPRAEITMWSTRSNNQYYTRFARLSSTMRSYMYFGPTLWNNLDNELWNCSTLRSFKRQIKCKMKMSKINMHDPVTEWLLNDYDTWFLCMRNPISITCCLSLLLHCPDCLLYILYNVHCIYSKQKV